MSRSATSWPLPEYPVHAAESADPTIDAEFNGVRQLLMDGLSAGTAGIRESGAGLPLERPELQRRLS